MIIFKNFLFDDCSASPSIIGVDNNTRIKITLRDLKEILNEVVINDIVEYEINEIEGNFEITIQSFLSDRLTQKINEYNQKKGLNSAKNNEEEDSETPKKVTFKAIEISETGLELIELISLDCSASEGVWTSDYEIKIDKNGFLIDNGKKTKTFWNGKVTFAKKPLRMKIRNIAGDETILIL